MSGDNGHATVAGRVHAKNHATNKDSQAAEDFAADLLEELHLGDRKDMKIGVFNLTWLVLPLGFYFLFEWAFEKFAPHIADGDLNLALFEAALFVPVVVFTLLAGKSQLAGWRMPRGLSWLWVAGPLWLGIVTPFTMAMENLTLAPEKAILWLAVSFFVAVNEETLFRGFILRGMMRGFRPLTAVLVSSVAFGTLHLMNLNAGGDPVFVIAQVISAAGIGTIMAAMTLRSGSIVPALLFHFIGDFVGLSALGGYEEGIQMPELAPSMVISGLVFFAWGMFWSWRAVKKNKLRY